jgi:hypothetical protein
MRQRPILTICALCRSSTSASHDGQRQAAFRGSPRRPLDRLPCDLMEGAAGRAWHLEHPLVALAVQPTGRSPTWIRQGVFHPSRSCMIGQTGPAFLRRMFVCGGVCPKSKRGPPVSDPQKPCLTLHLA